jgi:hypothetical protein|tara:strand:+ start:507 stop:971 length:465 start_codon:yes stop_codon:yes gene_type:complete
MSQIDFPNTKDTQKNHKTKRDLYNSVKWQNERIEFETEKMRGEFSTDNQRVKYLDTNVQSWIAINYVLWFIYYAIFFVVAYIIYQNESHGYTNKKKVYIGIAFFLFPFLITTIELLLYKFLLFLWSLITNTPYPKERNNTPSFSFMNALPPVYY